MLNSNDIALKIKTKSYSRMPNPISGEFYLNTEESEPAAGYNMQGTSSHLEEPPMVTG